MAAVRLLRKWSIPIATAAAVPVLTPVGSSDSKEKCCCKGSVKTRTMRPSELPIYEEPKDIFEYEYYDRKHGMLEDGIQNVREAIQNCNETTQDFQHKVVHIYETGVAHTSGSVGYILDEDNYLPKVGIITLGAVTGLLIAARRKTGLFKKTLYTSFGTIGATSLCYPHQAYDISQQIASNAQDFSAIAYNFVIGVKPQSNVDTKSDVLKTEDKPGNNTSSGLPNLQTDSEPHSSDETNKSSAVPEADLKDNISDPSGVTNSPVTEKSSEDKKSAETVPLIEKDYGQSNPEDTDMYTTRV